MSAVDYTVVLTSCGRFDLLVRTIRSFLAHADIPPARFLVIEDSGNEAVRAALAQVDAPIEVIVNSPQLGQMKSIDKAYATVDTPLIFHCEDDWEFFRSGFIAESAEVLAARPDVSMVGLRPRAELNPRVRELPAERLESGLSYIPFDPGLHPEYFSYSFNPGLRRTAEAKRFMPFDPRGGEEDVSWAFKQEGFRIATLESPAVRHIGDERHVDDPTKRKKPKTVLERLARSTRKRWKRLRRMVGGA
ncbi:hypothetical protein ACQ5SO_20480 [Rhodovulum sp. DZ06]|uniref:hypothetical protein n=1 Tax=Rhodovulum sp. DZ06 TaxID=3425126 RepID=UPI003D32B3A1